MAPTLSARAALRDMCQLARSYRFAILSGPAAIETRVTDNADVSDARALAVRQGVRLELIPVGWMAAEAVIAVGAGIAAKSVLLTAFGLDSVVELLSGI